MRGDRVGTGRGEHHEAGTALGAGSPRAAACQGIWQLQHPLAREQALPPAGGRRRGHEHQVGALDRGRRPARAAARPARAARAPRRLRSSAGSSDSTRRSRGCARAAPDGRPAGAGRAARHTGARSGCRSRRRSRTGAGVRANQVGPSGQSAMTSTPRCAPGTGRSARPALLARQQRQRDVGPQRDQAAQQLGLRAVPAGSRRRGSARPGRGTGRPRRARAPSPRARRTAAARRGRRRRRGAARPPARPPVPPGGRPVRRRGSAGLPGRGRPAAGSLRGCGPARSVRSACVQRLAAAARPSGATPVGSRSTTQVLLPSGRGLTADAAAGRSRPAAAARAIRNVRVLRMALSSVRSRSASARAASPDSSIRGVASLASCTSVQARARITACARSIAA